MNGAGVLAVAANQDQSGDQFLLLRPVIMRGGLAYVLECSPLNDCVVVRLVVCIQIGQISLNNVFMW